MHEMNIETLRDEAQRLLRLIIEKMQQMHAEPGVVTEVKGQTFDRASIPKQIEVLQGELSKLDGLEMVLAVVGTMKAGKSTTINAIVGTEVLPNRNRPMTALPTLIRHTPGQIEPLLKFANNKPINDLMADLGKVMSSREGTARLQALDRSPDMNELIRLIQEESVFGDTYQGADDIFWFLKSLNDLVRLAAELDVEFPFSSYDEIHEMPLIEVEFCHLREMDSAGGRLVLLDTPGPNESGQPHLRKMLKEQLEKASAVLAVLDYTQLKSDADAEVRRELEEIADVAKGRMYALVNKFDMTDRNGDNEAQVKEFVAGTLLKGLIGAGEVFPISSRWAYLANRARHELFVHNKLPSSSDQPWVADFGKEAFGTRWERRLEDVEEVQHSIDELWGQSLFGKPLESVIQAAHAQAAAYAVDAAAAKLIEHAGAIDGFLGNREISLKKDVQTLQGQIQALNEDIARITNSEKSARKQIERVLAEAEKSINRAFKVIEEDVLSKLNQYFKEGKRIEQEQAEAMHEDYGEPKGALDGFMRAFLGGRRGDRKRARQGQDFDPESPVISLSDQKTAKDLVSKIQRSVADEMKEAQEGVQQALVALIKDFREKFSNNVIADAKAMLNEMKDRLKDDDLLLNFRLPKVKPLALDFSASDMLDDIVSEKDRVVKRQRRKTGVWGTLCGWFDTTDWGWEEYSEREHSFEINIKDVRKSVLAGIRGAFDGLDAAASAYVEKSLKKGVDEFFSSFKTKVECIRGDLQQAILDQKLKKDEQVNLAKRLSKLRKHVPEALRDSEELKGQVEPVLKSGTEVTV